MLPARAPGKPSGGAWLIHVLSAGGLASPFTIGASVY